MGTTQTSDKKSFTGFYPIEIDWNIICNLLDKNRFFDVQDVQKQDVIKTLFTKHCKDKKVDFFSFMHDLCRAYDNNDDHNYMFYKILTNRLLNYPLKKRHEFYRIVLFNYIKLSDLAPNDVSNVLTQIISKYVEFVDPQLIELIVMNKKIDGRKLCKLIDTNNFEKPYNTFKSLDITRIHWHQIFIFLKNWKHEAIHKGEKKKEEKKEIEKKKDEKCLSWNGISVIQQCNNEQIIYILRNYVFYTVNNATLYKNKQAIISYFVSQNIDGSQLIEMDVDKFIKMMKECVDDLVSFGFNYIINNKFSIYGDLYNALKDFDMTQINSNIYELYDIYLIRSRAGLLVNGFIRSVDNDIMQIIPTEINEICFGYWYIYESVPIQKLNKKRLNAKIKNSVEMTLEIEYLMVSEICNMDRRNIKLYQQEILKDILIDWKTKNKIDEFRNQITEFITICIGRNNDMTLKIILRYCYDRISDDLSRNNEVLRFINIAAKYAELSCMKLLITLLPKKKIYNQFRFQLIESMSICITRNNVKTLKFMLEHCGYNKLSRNDELIDLLNIAAKTAAFDCIRLLFESQIFDWIYHKHPICLLNAVKYHHNNIDLINYIIDKLECAQLAFLCDEVIKEVIKYDMDKIAKRIIDNHWYVVAKENEFHAQLINGKCWKLFCKRTDAFNYNDTSNVGNEDELHLDDDEWGQCDDENDFHDDDQDDWQLPH